MEVPVRLFLSTLTTVSLVSSLFAADTQPLLRKRVVGLDSKKRESCEIFVDDRASGRAIRGKYLGSLYTTEERSFSVVYGDITDRVEKAAAAPLAKSRTVVSYPTPNSVRITYEAKNASGGWTTLYESSPVNEKTTPDGGAADLVGLLDQYCY